MSMRPPIGTRADYRWFTTVPTRWMDNTSTATSTTSPTTAGSTPRYGGWPHSGTVYSTAQLSSAKDRTQSFETQ